MRVKPVGHLRVTTKEGISGCRIAFLPVREDATDDLLAEWGLTDAASQGQGTLGLSAGPGVSQVLACRVGGMQSWFFLNPIR
jgi:hypothetical protein